MPNVVFVVPFALDTTMRFARAAAALPGVTIGVITQEPLERFPAEFAKAIDGCVRVKDALDVDTLTGAVRELAGRWGGKVDRLIGVLEQLQVPLARVRETLRIPGMDVREANNFRDKAQMKEALLAHDVPCARHFLATDAPSALAFAQDCGYPLVVKPPDGAGGKNTVRVENDEELRGTLRMLPPSAAAPVLLEEFMTGREHSFDSVTVGGKHVFHSISRYHPGPLEVMETPWIQWCVVLPREISGEEYADIHGVGKRALDALGMVTGLTHMEWFRRPDGSLAISEVAARPPGAQFTSLLSYAYDVDFYKLWAKLMATETFDAPERTYACGAVFLRGQGEGRVQDVEGLHELRRSLGDLVVDARFPKPGQPKASSYEGEGYVIVRDPDTKVVEDALDRVLETVRVKLG